MTVREFAEKASDSMMLKIMAGDEVIIVFAACYVGGIVDEILGLEVESFDVESVTRNRAHIVIRTVAEEDPDEGDPDEGDDDEGDDEPDGDEEPDEEDDEGEDDDGDDEP